MIQHGDGHDWANHEVHTEDGYIVNLFRLLPKGVKHGDPSFRSAGKPVLLMHGMGNKPTCWLDYDEHDGDYNLPVTLLQQGYDVWLGAQRGTSISSHHEKLDWDKDEYDYWNYSFPEMGHYDLPAILKTISDETDGQKISYIGYSLGTT